MSVISEAFTERVEFLGAGVEVGNIELGEAALTIYEDARELNIPITILGAFNLLHDWRIARTTHLRLTPKRRTGWYTA